MEKNLKKGQWLFTCAMKPKQFGNYDPRDPADYSSSTEEHLEWCKYDDFVTLEGSSHSQQSCGCHPISEEYAKWFLENKIDELYNDDDEPEDRFPNYEAKVKELCEKEGIEYEGI